MRTFFLLFINLMLHGKKWKKQSSQTGINVTHTRRFVGHIKEGIKLHHEHQELVVFASL